MPSILFFASFDVESNDNHVRIPNEFNRRGWSITRAKPESITLSLATVFCTDASGDIRPVEDHDLIWLFGFDRRETFLDRMQLLRSIDQSRFVNSIDAYTYFHGKTSFLTTELARYHPVSFASNKPDFLLSIVLEGGDWIVKPTAGSFGRDVFKVSSNDYNCRSILESVCSRGYVLLQEYVDTSHEKRWLIAGGNAIEAYGKELVDYRGNRAVGAKSGLTDYSQEECEVMGEVASVLKNFGIRFATCDIADNKILDVNFVNPGWLETYAKLSTHDFTRDSVDAILASLRR